VNKNKIVIRDLDGYFIPFTIEETERDFIDGKRVKRIYAESEHMELRTKKIIEPTELTGATINTALDFVLLGTRWKRGITEFAGSKTIKTAEYTTALAFLHKIASEFNVQLRFRVEIDANKIVGRYVDAILPNDEFDGKEITFGKDVIGIRRIENSGEVYTALYAIGAADENGNYVTIESVNNGKKYVEDLDAVQRWSEDGQHLFGIFQYQPENDEELTPSILKQKAQEALKNHINSVVKYEVDAVVLERIFGYEHEKIRKGMTIRIKDEKFNPPLYLEARVLETERSYTAKDRDKFVLGNYREVQVVKDPTIAKIQSKLFRNENAWTSSARVIRSETPPSDKHAIWIDITKTPEVPMTYDFTTNEWKKASPTVAEEIGAETPTGAQQKADTAREVAIEIAAEDATTKANTAEQNAKQYAEQYTQQYAEQKPPNVIPAVPANFTAAGSFKKVILNWNIDTSKTVSHYELHGSQTQGFTPDSTNLLWKGKQSSFVHEADVNQTWYYRLRAVNAYGQAGPFTQEVSAITAKIISDDILFGAVNSQILADLAVTAAKLADGSVTTDKISNSAVNNAKLANLAVDAAKLQNGIIDNTKLADLAVTAQKLADGSITTPKVADGAVNTAKIADAAITSAKISNLAVGSAAIADGAIITAKIANLAVGNAAIQDGAITNAKIGSTAVDTAQIKDAAVTSAKIANLAVGNAAIANAAVNAAKIANLAVGTAQIADAAITNAKIANLAVDNAKIASLHGSKITAGSITADKLNVTSLSAISANLGTVTAGTLQAVTLLGVTGDFTGTLNAHALNVLSEFGGTIKIDTAYWGSGGSVWTPTGQAIIENDSSSMTPAIDIRHSSGNPSNFIVNMEGKLNAMRDIVINAGYGIMSAYNNGHILKDHNNGNITISATGGQLYLGYYNTTIVRSERQFNVYQDGEAIRVEGSSTGNAYARFAKGAKNIGYVGSPTTSNDNFYVYSYNNIVQFNGAKLDTTGGAARWQLDNLNYIYQQSNGQIRFYMDGIVKHTFNPDGTKSGGSIEIDGKNLGMSPIDSPQILLEYIEFDIPLMPTGIKVYIEERFRKAIENFAVFPNNGQVIEKGYDYFVIAGEGTADVRIVGERIGYADTFFDDLDAYEVA
jgi:phage minor structural protein